MSIVEQLRARHDRNNHGHVRFGVSAIELMPSEPSESPVTDLERERRGKLAHLDQVALDGQQLRRKTAQWLAEQLRGGALTVSEIQRKAATDRLNWRMVRHAASYLNVVRKQNLNMGVAAWELRSLAGHDDRPKHLNMGVAAWELRSPAS